MVYNFTKLFKNCFIHKNCSSFSFSTCAFKKSSKTPHSSLLISGKRAKDTFVVVIPHLDFDDRFKNVSLLEENIKKRKLSFDLLEMKESWNFYKDWNNKKLKLQESLSEVGKLLGGIAKLEENEENKNERERLDRFKNILREELQEIKNNVWDMEDNVLCDLLNLPNALHPKAPEKEEDLFIFDKESIGNKFDHLDVGVKLNYIEYRNKQNYFLKNEAALFELAVAELFVNKFHEQGFIRFSNPDFTRSVLSEGVGLSPNDSQELYLLENTESNNDRLHLCGGASLFPFCGYHAKHSVPKHLLPVRYIAAGRHYSPVSSTLPGLYSVNQSTSVQAFVATSGEEELYHEFESCVKICCDIFSALGLSFKAVSQPPQFLKNWESLRVSFQVYSPYEKTFVEVGNVGLIDDFISKRLRMCYTDKNEEPFLKVLSGTAVNTQTLLALCLERSDSELFIPDVIKDFMVA